MSGYFNIGKFKVLVWVYGNTFPFEAYENLRKFHFQGGCFVFLGGVPCCHPCVKEDEVWEDKIEQLGWKWLSRDKMGAGMWGEVTEYDGLVYEEAGEPLGLGAIDWSGVSLQGNGAVFESGRLLS